MRSVVLQVSRMWLKLTTVLWRRCYQPMMMMRCYFFRKLAEISAVHHGKRCSHGYGFPGDGALQKSHDRRLRWELFLSNHKITSKFRLKMLSSYLLVTTTDTVIVMTATTIKMTTQDTKQDEAPLQQPSLLWATIWILFFIQTIRCLLEDVYAKCMWLSTLGSEKIVIYT